MGHIMVRASAAACFAGLVAATPAPPGAAAQTKAPDNARVLALTQAYDASGLALFRYFSGTPGNIVLSPYSIGSAMAMALAGARGATETQMIAVLKHHLVRADVDTANGAALAILNGYDSSRAPPTCPVGMHGNGQQCETAPPANGQCEIPLRREGKQCVGAATPAPSARLLVANALMVGKRFDQIAPGYVALLKNRYAAEVFRNAGLDEINVWVKRKTEGKIDKILDQLDPNRAAVLLNAVYFKARWAATFDANLTRDDDFSLSRTETVQLPMMNQSDNYATVAREGYRAVRLPYQIPALGLVIVLPDAIDGVDDVGRRIDVDELSGLLAALHESKKLVALALPRFKAEFTADLVSPLRQAGMTLAFGDEADFSGMSGRPPAQDRVKIDQIQHRAVIEVTEESTEAAAATAVVSNARSLPIPPTPEVFRVDHPFLFYLIDDATGAVLFAGRIADPRPSASRQ